MESTLTGDVQNWAARRRVKRDRVREMLDKRAGGGGGGG